MNRIISFFIVVAIIFSFCACGTAADGSSKAKDAKPFELRSGIHFGDTIDDVKQKETTLKYITEDSEKKYIVFSGNIAGFDDAHAYFYYDDNNRVNEVEYSFLIMGESADAKRIYETIYNSCVRQYGEPLSRGTEYPIAGRAVSSAYNSIERNNNSGGKGELLGYDQWAILGDDGNNTKIDLINYMTASYMPSLGMVGIPGFIVSISYTPFQQATIDGIDSEF